MRGHNGRTSLSVGCLSAQLQREAVNDGVFGDVVRLTQRLELRARAGADNAESKRRRADGRKYAREFERGGAQWRYG